MGSSTNRFPITNSDASGNIGAEGSQYNLHNNLPKNQQADSSDNSSKSPQPDLPDNSSKSPQPDLQTDFFSANNDWTGIRIIGKNQEVISYQNNSTIRIWYNRETHGFDFHWHAALEIIMPVENYYDVLVGQTSFHLLPDEILLIPPRELHRIEDPPTGARHILLFDLEPLSRLKGYSGIQAALTSPVYITSTSFPESYKKLVQFVLDMRDEYFSKKQFSELSVYARLIEFLVTIGEEKTSSLEMFRDKEPQKQQKYIDKFSRLLEYVDSHYMEDLTLENMASYTGFSKFHFSHLFKDYTGFTFCDYLRFRRIKAAEILLENPTLPITEIALMSGFPSISTFNRIFKEQKKRSPSEYRSLIANRKTQIREPIEK